MRFENAIRKLPVILLGVAGISFVRALMAVGGFWLADVGLARLDRDHGLTLFALAGGVLSALIAPFTWITWAAILTLLLALYDRSPK